MSGRVINKRAKEFVRNSNQIYIGRGSPWGNPFTHLALSRTKAQSQVATEEESMVRYEAWLRERLAKEPGLKQELLKPDGHELVCYCKPRPCHGDILIKLIEEFKTTGKAANLRNELVNSDKEEKKLNDKKNDWQITKRGYSFYVVLSALQKAIRRGDARLACYWAAELYQSGFGPALWNRLLIISAEDCWGMVTQHVEALRHELNALESADKQINKGKDGSNQKPLNLSFVVKAAYLLALAQKCRDVDNFICLIYAPGAIAEEELLTDLHAAQEGERIPIPADALDKHTIEGKMRLKKLGWTTKQMAEHFILKETTALRPRHPGEFDSLLDEIAEHAEPTEPRGSNDVQTHG